MKNLALALLSVTLFAACSQSKPETNKGSFVTLLGNDTLAIEQFMVTDSAAVAKVVLRSPQTSFSLYRLILDDNGGILKMGRTSYPADSGFAAEGKIDYWMVRSGDSLKIEVRGDDETRNFTAPYQEGILPFIDMVHWPFEMAFKKAAKTGQDTLNQPMLSGRNVSNFIVAAIENDSMTIRHPFRGVMGVNVNDYGNLIELDAGLTTRKLKVHRVPDIDIDNIGNRFAAQDQSGNPFGSLSGAVSTEFSFKGTDFRVDYGSPQKRGRELFGGIVPWGERWRTGANRATHFYTSKNLRVGDLEVPAGEYTLFTIPEPDGGTLMINKQTGQNGQSYDESRDLGRVPMNISTQDEVTEAFTITAEETDEGGVLKLIWGETVFSVDFKIE